MNRMKDYNTMQYGYYLVLITFERDFRGDWVDVGGNTIIKT